MTTTLSMPASAHEVTVTGENGARLAGTLTMPATTPSGGAPAMLLIQGSGPTDRDGNQSAAIVTNLERQLAEALAKDGIAALRVDKRGQHANAGEMPRERASLAAFVRWESAVGDAVAAWHLLTIQAGIDARRVGIVGHSEGGILALEAAARLRETGVSPAALVLASTPGRPLAEILRDQLGGLMKSQGVPDQRAQRLLARNDAILAEIQTTGRVPPDVPAGLQALYPNYLGPFLQSLSQIAPTALAAHYDGPVLVIAGGADRQVSPTADAGALDSALAKRRPDDHELVVFPGVSHNLKPVHDADDAGFAGEIPPAILDKVAAWLLVKLARRH